MPKTPKSTTGSKLPTDKDTRKLTPRQWIDYNKSLGYLQVPSNAPYPSFRDPNESYLDIGPNGEIIDKPFISYNTNYTPKVTPTNQPMQMGSNLNYNPNTGQYFNPITQSEIKPIIEQYYKGGDVKGYAYGGSPYYNEQASKQYVSPYTQQGQNVNQGGGGAKLAGAFGSTTNILGWANQGKDAVQAGLETDDYGYISDPTQRAINQGITPTYKHVGDKLREGDYSGALKEQFLGAQWVRGAQALLGNDKKDTKFNRFFGVGDDYRAAEKAREDEQAAIANQEKEDRKLAEDSILEEKMALRDMGITGLKDEYLASPQSGVPQGYMNAIGTGMQTAGNNINNIEGGNMLEKSFNAAKKYLQNTWKKKDGGKVGYNMGGDIKGRGGPKDDAIEAEIEEGAFIVPSERVELAKIIRNNLFPGTENQKATLKDKKSTSVPVMLSNMEHKFTKEEKDEIVSELGEEFLEYLAPNAEDESEEMREGGLTAAKARKILHDKQVRGHDLTDKQRRYMGWIASGKMKCGGMVKGYMEGGEAEHHEEMEKMMKKEMKGYKNGGKIPGYAEGGGIGDLEKQLAEIQRKQAALEKKRQQDIANEQKLSAAEKAAAAKRRQQSYSEEKQRQLKKDEAEIQKYIEQYKSTLESGTYGSETRAKRYYDLAVAKMNDYKSKLPKEVQVDEKSDLTTDDFQEMDLSKGLLPKYQQGQDDELEAAKRLNQQVSTPTTRTTAKTPVKQSYTGQNIDADYINSLRPGLYEDVATEPQNAAESIAGMNQQRQPVQQTTPYSGVDPNLEIYNRDLEAGLARNAGMPQNQGQGSNVDWNNVAGALVNYGIPALQVGMGLKNLKKAGDRPVDQLDPDFMRSVSRSAGTAAEAKARAQYGLSPEVLAYLDQQNQVATRNAMAAARNYSGGSAANALSLSGAALGDSYGRMLQTKVADAQAKDAKYGDYLNAQRYNDQLVGMKSDMNRRLFTDNLNAWNADTNSASALVNTGLTNSIDSFRADQRRKDYQKLMQQANTNYNYNPYQ